MRLFSSANASFIYKNVEKMYNILFAEEIKRKRKKEKTKQSIYTTKHVVILKNTGQIIKNHKHIKCVWIRNVNSKIGSKSVLTSRPA